MNFKYYDYVQRRAIKCIRIVIFNISRSKKLRKKFCIRYFYLPTRMRGKIVNDAS